MLWRRAGEPATPADTAPRVPLGWAAAIATGGGLIGVFAFPRFGFWPLAILSVTALSVAVDGRRSRTGAWLGLLYGLAFFGPLLHWTGVYVGAAPWLILTLGEAAFFAALGATLPLVQPLRFAPAWVACLWVTEEALRDRFPFGGFPWGRLAFSQARSPIKWFAALGGAPVVTFVVAFSGVALWWAIRRVQQSEQRGIALTPVVVVPLAAMLAAPVVGALLSWPLDPGKDKPGHTTRIALIQGSVPERGLDFEERARQVLDNHIAQTKLLIAQVAAGTVARPDLVLWPENASDVDPFNDPTAYAEIDAVVKQLGVPVLVGAILDGPGPNHRRNAGILWSPTTGPGAQYIKRHPVPFGEYIPLRSVAKLVSSDVGLVTQDMVGGHGNGVLAGWQHPIGDVICFEVAYDSLVQSSVRHGAQLLVVQTNNATFGHTAETYQQLAMSQLRAVELGRTVLQVATTGKSAIIGPDGQIRQESGDLFTPDVLMTTVPLRTVHTLAVRVGPVPEYVLAAVGLLVALGTGIKRRAARPQLDAETKDMVTT